MDDAFIMRFHTMIHFPLPNAAERLVLWEKMMPAIYEPESAVNLKELASKYELTGAAILNIVYHATLKCLSNNDVFIRWPDMLEGIRLEYKKEERSMG